MPSFEGRTISAITVRCRGYKTVADDRLLRMVRMGPGDIYNLVSSALLGEDIVRLYQAGLVDDLNLFGEVEGASGMRLIMDVVTPDRVMQIGFEGNIGISNEKLGNEVALNTGGIISEKEIFAARSRIRMLYEESGYPSARISHHINRDQQNRGVRLVFGIDEGVKSEMPGRGRDPADILRIGSTTPAERKILRELQKLRKGGDVNKKGRYFGRSRLFQQGLIIDYLAKGEVDLSDSRISDDDLSLLGSLPNLTRLNLDFTGITNAGLERLSRLTELEALSLEASQITGIGLGQIRELTKLTRLNLRGTEVSTPDLIHLAAMSNLEWLILEDTAVNDAVLAHLKGLTKLKGLYLTDTQVTREGALNLRAALPACKISR